MLFLKFIYSEKAKNFCEIFTLLLSYVVPVKSKVKISQNFVAFSEYMNFKNGDNAQSSCAGLFINANLGFDYPGVWLHVDMAFPVEHSVRFLKFSFLFLFFRIRITRHPLARDCLSMQILALIILEFSSILIWPNL